MDDKVLDSRNTRDGLAIRRRRECLGCEKRFTTYERIEETVPTVVKKDGRREPFNRIKVIEGLKKACQKRDISIVELDNFVDTLEQKLQDKNLREVESSVIGEEIMSFLKGRDQVAYVRFASVYRSFKDISEFMNELKELLIQHDT
jgi:transcriptional repressor NrdR